MHLVFSIAFRRMSNLFGRAFVPSRLSRVLRSTSIFTLCSSHNTPSLWLPKTPRRRPLRRPDTRLENCFTVSMPRGVRGLGRFHEHILPWAPTMAPSPWHSLESLRTLERVYSAAQTATLSDNLNWVWRPRIIHQPASGKWGLM